MVCRTHVKCVCEKTTLIGEWHRDSASVLLDWLREETQELEAVLGEQIAIP